jgi:glycosyltransferase involved in cell wall biosynthesis
MCAYNEASHVTGAIRSLESQTIDPATFELIFVDDGSSDETIAIVERTISNVSFETTILRNERNRGLIHTANKGLDHAIGEYVVRLDADDAFAPSALEALLRGAKLAETDLVYSNRFELDSDTGTVTYVDVDSSDLFSLVAAGTLFDRETAIDVGGYNDVFWEEYDFYIRFLEESGRDPVHVPRPLMVYLQHGESMTADDARVQAGWRELINKWGKQTLREYGTLPPDSTTYES